MRDVSRALGRYEVLDELGRGGMATVYLARQVDLDRLVALKELRALQTPDPAFAQRFLREARLAGSLNHPNVVTVHDYFERRRRAVHRDGVPRARVAATVRPQRLRARRSAESSRDARGPRRRRGARHRPP